MEIKRIKKSHTKGIVIGVISVSAIILLVVYAGSRAKYKVTESIPLVNGTINYEIGDFNTVAMYQANESGTYTEITKMPESGYVINEEKSYCKVNGTKDDNARLYTNENSEHVIANLQKNSKCYVWFDVKGMSILEMVTSHNPTAGITDFTGSSTTNEGLKSGTDDDGTTYYFRGNVTNNWVQFAGFYWRIIRINGDGSIRLIYNGPTTVQTGETTQIGTTAFNSSYNSAEYVGIKYTIGSQHGTGVNSSVLGPSTSTDITTLNGWYNSKIKDTQYEKYIDKGGKFCSDRNVASGHSSYPGTTGVGTTATVFAPADRLLRTNLSNYKITQTPTLKCSSASDRLIMSVGLITSDEVEFAGGFGGITNSSYYLYTNQNYWTMSPRDFNTFGWANVFRVNSNGYIDNGNYRVNTANGVRPVINLASNVKLTGTGTTSDPYKVV